MSETTEAAVATPAAPTSPDARPPEAARPAWRRRLALLGFGNVGAVYVWLAIIVVFSIWAPDTFPTWGTVQTVLNQNAIPGFIALSLVVPLSARVFDLSVGNAMGLCSALVAWLLVERHVGIAGAIAITLLGGVAIGLVNATIVVVLRIDSFIGTLATGALMASGVTLLTDEQAIIGPQLSGSFAKIATSNVGGIATPVFVMFAVAIAVWVLLRYTVTGRRLYATGFNEEGAVLAGIPTRRLRFASLIVSGVVAGIAGVILTSQVGSGTPDIGPAYLLDAYAAVFLGATQLGGRFNAWGTVIAVLLVGTGKNGLAVVGAPLWAESMFSGVVLLAALALTNVERARDVRAWRSARRRRATAQ